MLPAMARLPEVRGLVDRGKYFVVHAPRQTGKTTALLTFGRELTAEGQYVAVMVSMETASVFRDDIAAAELCALSAWRMAAEDRLPAELWPPPWPDAPPGSRITAALSAWAKAAPRPLVLFIDEIDSLEGPALVSVLRQLRQRFADRPAAAPWSLALIGMRDVHDYKIAMDGRDGATSGSPFNVKDRSLLLRDFTRDEVATLYAQHTTESGQPFAPDVVDRAFALTQGQPWLVNALAEVTTEELRGKFLTDAFQAVDFLHDNFNRFQDRTARFGQATNALAVAGKNIDTELFLQLDDRFRHARLRCEQRFSRLGQIEILPNGFTHETELMQVHGGFLLSEAASMYLCLGGI